MGTRLSVCLGRGCVPCAAWLLAVVVLLTARRRIVLGNRWELEDALEI